MDQIKSDKPTNPLVKSGEIVIGTKAVINTLSPKETENVDKDKPKHAGGRPCMFCQNKDEYTQKANEYLDKCQKGREGKQMIPFIEELAFELNTIDENIVNWANKKVKGGSLEHEEFFTIYTRVKMLQKLRLKQRSLGRYNPTGALTLLRFDHGAVETSKQILAGDKNEPLEITITEEKHNLDE